MLSVVHNSTLRRKANLLEIGEPEKRRNNEGMNESQPMSIRALKNRDRKLDTSSENS